MEINFAGGGTIINVIAIILGGVAGINLMFGNKIRVANLLPALIIAIFGN